jgi:hypothetical protein
LIATNRPDSSILNTTAQKSLLAGGLVCLLLTTVWFFRRPPPAPTIAPPTPSTPASTAPIVAPADPLPPPPASPAPAKSTAASNPPLAAASAFSPGPPSHDIDQVREWARQDPARAITWLAQAPPGEARDAVVEIVCAEVASFDPAQAVTLAERYAGGNVPLLENLVQQWSEQNQNAAIAFALARPAGETRNRLLARVSLTQARTDPVAAGQLVIKHIQPGETQDEAIISVLHQWALRDVDAALAWVREFPPGGLRDRALNEIASAHPLPTDPTSAQPR